MVKSLAFLVFLTISSFTLIQHTNGTLVQDDDGLIKLIFTKDHGKSFSMSIMKSDQKLISYHFDDETQMIAFLTIGDHTSASGFDFATTNHLSFQFVKFNPEEKSFDIMYQTGFRIDKDALLADYGFSVVDKFQINNYGQEGVISFDLEHGKVSFMNQKILKTKEMARINVTVDSLGTSHFELPTNFSFGEANQSPTLLN